MPEAEAAGRQAGCRLSACGPPDGGRSMCADLLKPEAAQASADQHRNAARMLGRFRHLEAPEEQPEGEQDDLEHGDGKGKDAAPP